MSGMSRFVRSRSALVAAIGLFVCAPALGQDEVEPKKEPTMIPGPFRAFVVVDNRFDKKEQENGFKDERNREGHIHCSVSEHGLKPFVGVISRRVPADSNDPLFALLQALDGPEGPGEKYRLQRMGLFAIFPLIGDRYLHENSLIREAAVAEVNKLGNDLNANRLVLSLAESDVAPTGVGGEKVASPKLEKYQIGNETEVTVIFSHNLKVVGRWDFTKDNPITNAAIQEILKSVDEELEPLTRGRKR